jgi:hypothetical protein
LCARSGAASQTHAVLRALPKVGRTTKTGEPERKHHATPRSNPAARLAMLTINAHAHGEMPLQLVQTIPLLCRGRIDHLAGCPRPAAFIAA